MNKKLFTPIKGQNELQEFLSEINQLEENRKKYQQIQTQKQNQNNNSADGNKTNINRRKPKPATASDLWQGFLKNLLS